LIKRSALSTYYSRSGHTKDLEHGTFGLSNPMLNVGGWVQENSSGTVLPLTRHHCNAAFTAEVAAWSTAQASGDGRRRPLVTLRMEYQASVTKLKTPFFYLKFYLNKSW